MLPTDPGVQHEQDPLQHLPVVERLASRLAETPLPHRQQRLDPLHSPSGTTHGFARMDIPLTTDADGLRHRETVPPLS
jgi:hypothetical protein